MTEIERNYFDTKGFTEVEPNLFECTMKKTVEVAFRGEMESTLKIAVYVDDNVKAYRVAFWKDGHHLLKRKTYSFGWARTVNAIRETVNYAGFSFIR